MLIEKAYGKFSLKDMIIQWLSIFIIFFILQFIIFNLIAGRSFTDDFFGQWFFVMVFPFLYTLIIVYHNKNGTMTISDLGNPQKILSGIDQVMDKWGFKETRKENERTVYDKKTKWGRFWNYIYKEGLEVIHEGDNIKLKGKRNTFLKLEYKLKKM